jgi:hypothetical protein
MSEQAAPPPPAAPSSPKPSGGIRALAVLGAIVLAFAAAVMIVAAADIGGTPTIKECTADNSVIPSDGKCFDGSKTKRTISVALMYISGALGAAAVLLALMFAATGRRGRLLTQLMIAAVLLGGLGILVGSI